MYIKSLLLALMVSLPAAAKATTIDFNAVGPYDALTFSQDILTVSGSSGNIYMDGFNGIGVGDVFLDVGEVMTYSFSAEVTNVMLRDASLWHNSDVRFEGFLGAASLGTEDYNAIDSGRPEYIGISGFFGGSLTSFTVTVLGGILPKFTATAISYDLAPVGVVPLPAGGYLLLGALAGFGALARRRQRS